MYPPTKPLKMPARIIVPMPPRNCKSNVPTLEIPLLIRCGVLRFPSLYLPGTTWQLQNANLKIQRTLSHLSFPDAVA